MRALLFITLLCFVPLSQAQKGVFLSAADFYTQAFDANSAVPVSAQMLWLNKALQVQAKGILGHRFRRMRTRYQMQGSRTAWIFEEIGKIHPITIGVVVDSKDGVGQVAAVKILEYRESRGGEVRYPTFMDQFLAAEITGEKHKLDRYIDGITGATLSVRAVKKVARLALYFHAQTPAVNFVDAAVDVSIPTTVDTPSLEPVSVAP